MEKISKDVLREAHLYLEWDFHEHKQRGEGGKEDNVWNKQRLLIEKYIKYKMEVIISKEMDSQAIVGEVQQLLRREKSYFDYKIIFLLSFLNVNTYKLYISF